MDSNMDLILDMMPDENVIFEQVKADETNEYYQGHAEHILKSIIKEEHYFHFVNTILKEYQTLTPEHKKIIEDRMGIQPVVQEKVVYKEKIVYKEKKKARVNDYDDY